jgi:hypothetical protein
MSSLGEILPLEYVGPLAGGGSVPVALCQPGSCTPTLCNTGNGTEGGDCKPGSHTSGGSCGPTGSATAGGWCNTGNGMSSN